LLDWVKRTTSTQSKLVLQGEGRGKISSPHSIKILGTKSLPKWGGMIRSEWKKMEETACKVILMVSPILENWRLKVSGAILKHQTTFLGVKTFFALAQTP
jgi:hypothetical protein